MGRCQKEKEKEEEVNSHFLFNIHKTKHSPEAYQMKIFLICILNLYFFYFYLSYKVYYKTNENFIINKNPINW
jgi:hypothetical protein